MSLRLAWIVPFAFACEEAPPSSEPPPGDPCEEGGNICTWAGTPGLAFLAPEGLHRTKTGFYWPHDVLFTPEGDAYVPDFNNHRIQWIHPDGIVTTLSGSGWLGDGPPDIGEYEGCWYGCDLGLSDWWHPGQMAADPSSSDVFWVASWHNHRVVRVDLVGQRMEWWGGAGEEGFREGERDQALFAFPSSVVVAPGGTQYVSDQGNHVIRRIGVDGIVEVFAGQPGGPGYEGDGGPAAEARIRSTAEWVGAPAGRMVLDGNRLLFADTLNSILRVIDLDTGIIDRFAGKFVSTGVMGQFNTVTGEVYEGELDGKPGHKGDGEDMLDARFSWPRDLVVAPAGDIFVADSSNHCVRRIDPSGEESGINLEVVADRRLAVEQCRLQPAILELAVEEGFYPLLIHQVMNDNVR